MKHEMSDYRIEAATKKEWANRALVAEAKLAKAVEALRFIGQFNTVSNISTIWKVTDRARTTLAELEGKE